MGVRPPANDDDGPTVVAFGIAALEAQLRDADLSYPADGEEILAATGDVEVPIDAAGHSMRLSVALDAVERDQFDSERELMNALHPVFEEKREATTTSLLAQLRSLVPF